ncbi:MAG: ornithine cyclodeaminase family protein, partial [Candidatus Binatia bacterium]
ALANPEAPVLGILGAGVQAKAHIRALCKVRKITRIKIHSPSGRSALRLKEDLEPVVGINIEVVDGAVEAVREADLLVTATTAKEPIVSSDWLNPGVHINAIGSHRPDLREIDAATLSRAKIVVDSRAAIMAECGDILLAIKEGAIAEEHIYAEIGEILAGKKPGRRNDKDITLYKSVGIAVQDVAAARLVYQRALDHKAGVRVEM